MVIVVGVHLSVARAHRAGPLNLLVALVSLVLALLSQVVHTVTTVQCRSNLLVCLNEALKLDVQVPVLSLQHVAVVVQSIDFSPHIVIATLQRLV